MKESEDSGFQLVAVVLWLCGWGVIFFCLIAFFWFFGRALVLLWPIAAGLIALVVAVVRVRLDGRPFRPKHYAFVGLVLLAAVIGLASR